MNTVSLAKVINEFDEMVYEIELRFNGALINSDMCLSCCYLNSILDLLLLRAKITDENLSDLIIKYHVPLKNKYINKFIGSE